MKPTALFISILVLGATVVSAGTFEPATYLAEPQVDVLNRTVANAQFGKDLFGGPYATAVVGNVDVYDRFPYVEARYFQIVSDPSWNRLLMGEIGRGLDAYDGKNEAFGALAAPRGLSTDALGRVYVADSGNNRVVVFQSETEFDHIELHPLYTIDNLNKPFDVAYSDGGTPFDEADDRLYIANTGANEVRRYEMTDDGMHFTHAVGELGSGQGSFAGPMALTVGRSEGKHSDDVYVTDAHNRRIVHLRDTGASLAWSGEARHDLGTITSLDTDHHGNLYAAAPQMGQVAKFTGSLMNVANLDADIVRPRNFHVPFANVTDHRTGERSRAGQGNGIIVEEWAGDSGLRLVNLGIEVNDATAADDDGATVRMTLTDHADVTAEIVDKESGDVIARHDAGVLAAGPATLRFDAEDFVAAWDAREYTLTLSAASTYNDKMVTKMEMPIELNSEGTPSLPDKLTMLGNRPNPFNPVTTIRFVVPQGANRNYSLKIYDVRGRLVRDLAAGQIGSGLQEVTWNGRNNGGTSVSSGIYLYRLEVGAERLTGKMVLVK